MRRNGRRGQDEGRDRSMGLVGVVLLGSMQLLVPGLEPCHLFLQGSYPLL